MKPYRFVQQVRLSPWHQPTGKTRHHHGAAELPVAVVLKIARYDDAEGFYLLHFDADGNELTDTFHESVEDARAQADWEYEVKPYEWETIEGQL
jgi:hypothetical protein